MKKKNTLYVQNVQRNVSRQKCGTPENLAHKGVKNQRFMKIPIFVIIFVKFVEISGTQGKGKIGGLRKFATGEEIVNELNFQQLGALLGV